MQQKLIKCVFVWQLHCMCVGLSRVRVGVAHQSMRARTRNTRDTVVVNQNISDTETITMQRGRRALVTECHRHPALYTS